MSESMGVVKRDEQTVLRERIATLTEELVEADAAVRAAEAAHNELIAGKPLRWEGLPAEALPEVGVTTSEQIEDSLQNVINARAAADRLRRELLANKARLNAAGG
jgi:hypothetical protein